MTLLYRLTVRSAADPPAFNPSSLILRFESRHEADLFAEQLAIKYAVYGPFEQPGISVHVSPVPFREARPAGRGAIHGV